MQSLPLRSVHWDRQENAGEVEPPARAGDPGGPGAMAFTGAESKRTRTEKDKVIVPHKVRGLGGGRGKPPQRNADLDLNRGPGRTGPPRSPSGNNWHVYQCVETFYGYQPGLSMDSMIQLAD